MWQDLTWPTFILQVLILPYFVFAGSNFLHMIINADHLTSLQYKRYMALKGPTSAEELRVCQMTYKCYTCQHVCISSEACCNDRDRNVKNKRSNGHICQTCLVHCFNLITPLLSPIAISMKWNQSRKKCNMTVVTWKIRQPVFDPSPK